MSWLDALRARRTADRDLADEIQEHLQEKIDTLVADGVPPDVAAARARREFGNVTLIAEQSRDVWRWRLADDALIRCALRRATAASLSVVHPGGARDAGARHRCEHRDIQHGRSGAARTRCPFLIPIGWSRSTKSCRSSPIGPFA